ncbi:MAG: hypothetical protein ACSLEN_04580 [Candidatus Malihini olakiniferum]
MTIALEKPRSCLFLVQEVHRVDTTPLTVEEITNQCRALAHAVIELENSAVKEILSFMLTERWSICMFRWMRRILMRVIHAYPCIKRRGKKAARVE